MSYGNIPLQFNTAAHRFEMNIDGKEAFIKYRQAGNTVHLIHTEVDEMLQGQGIAAELVEKTLHYLEGHNLTLVPECSYVQQYLHKHPEWNKLVAAE